jgi:hypothetical protein
MLKASERGKSRMSDGDWKGALESLTDGVAIDPSNNVRVGSGRLCRLPKFIHGALSEFMISKFIRGALSKFIRGALSKFMSGALWQFMSGVAWAGVQWAVDGDDGQVLPEAQGHEERLQGRPGEPEHSCSSPPDRLIDPPKPVVP